jgi:RNA polymerase sigma-70 factor (ECF subfamily)
MAGRVPKRWQAVLTEDDVMQQTYASAIAAIRTFGADDESAFARWLTTIARRNLDDALRMLKAEKRGGNRWRIEAGSTDETYVDLYDRLAESGTTPSKHVSVLERKSVLERALSELPEDYRRVVVLYDLERRPVAEVADTMRRSQGAVFMLRARALDRLHEVMGGTSEFFSR